MKYSEKCIMNIKRIAEAYESILKYRMNDTDFTRRRKMTFERVIYYNLNKKGLSSKMEVEEFNEKVDCADISSPAVLQQREKLSADIFIDMRKVNLIDFYNNRSYKKKVKLFKGYIVAATDGSDFEIPNTATTRKNFDSTKDNTSVARAHVSNTFDVLNRYILSTVIDKENADEREMEKENLREIKEMNLSYPIIRTKDRGYVSLADIYYSIKNNDKFVVRLKKSDFKKQVSAMKSNDEIITIPYNYNRARYYKDKNPEFYKLLEETKMDIKVRCVKIELSTGEIEILITNLTKKEASLKELEKLYDLRWGVETNYHALKESLKIETITSSKDNLIKQDIHSQIFVFNLLQAQINDLEEDIEQEKYKHEMKINFNMAIGFFKKFFLYIIIEEDDKLRQDLLNTLADSIASYLVPIRKGRHYTREPNKKNKYSINKRKTF